MSSDVLGQSDRRSAVKDELDLQARARFNFKNDIPALSWVLRDGTSDMSGG
jgi:hypothetical protein